MRLNGFAKAYNRMPKENSKHQTAKHAAERVYEKVCCAECGRTNTALYKMNEFYYCKEHKPNEA